jgi:serine/threonine protein kinase/Flp pilus assembly protein TadD
VPRANLADLSSRLRLSRMDAIELCRIRHVDGLSKEYAARSSAIIRASALAMESARWKQIEDLSAAARELEPASREAFLRQKCPDEDLRRVVEAVLNGDAIIDEDSTQTEPPDLRRLGPYEVLGLLGAGGMGRVFKARDTRLNRFVAIKFLSAELTDESAHRRFQLETKTASSLNHPHIVTVHEAGESEGRPYLVTEYVDGGTLRHWLATEKPPVQKIVELLAGVADGLACAHENGVLHRDIKPGNILVSRTGYAKLADFGLARILEEVSPENETRALTEQRTRAGAVLGTLAYMSPEQALGEPVDARSDVFSFGVLLYEVFTGRRPFQGRSSVAVMRMIADEQPAEPRSLAPDLPVSLEAITLRCLRKRPEDRYRTARELAAELHKVSRHFIAESEHPGNSAANKRRRRVLRVAGAGVIVLASGVIFFVPSARRIFLPGRIVAPDRASEFDSYKAGEDLLNRYDKAGNVDRAVDDMNAAIRQNPNYAPAYAGLSEAYLLRNVLSPEANWVSLARDSATKAVGLNPDLAVAHVALGNALSEAGRRKEAIAEFEHAKDLDPKSWAAVVGLADAASATGNKTEAETFYRKAMELAPDSWGPYKNYGTFLYSNQRYDEALTAWQHALRLTPDNVRLLRNEAAAYLMLSRYEDSASALQTALTIEPAAGLYTNLGILRFFQGRFSDAVPPFEKATQLAPTNYNNWGNLGDAYRWAPGMQAKAAAVYARAIDLIQAKLAATPDDPELRANLAGYLAKSERKSLALAQLERYNRLPNKTGKACFNAAIAWEVAGDRENALRSLEAAIRAKYSLEEIRTEQELSALRSDFRYQQLLANLAVSGSPEPR